MPTIASIGRLTCPLGDTGADIQPTVADASRITINTPVAVMVPLTVMALGSHDETGPSVMGVERVERSGAAQPACEAAAIALSLRNGLDIAHSCEHRIAVAITWERLPERAVHARSCALGPSHRSMSGGPESRPVHDRAISTITAPSKWARCDATESHFSITR